MKGNTIIFGIYSEKARIIDTILYPNRVSYGDKSVAITAYLCVNSDGDVLIVFPKDINKVL